MSLYTLFYCITRVIMSLYISVLLLYTLYPKIVIVYYYILLFVTLNKNEETALLVEDTGFIVCFCISLLGSFWYLYPVCFWVLLQKKILLLDQ